VLAVADWNAITIAGGFIIGVVAGGVAAIRVFRWTLDYMARRHDDPGPPPPH